jgi:electron transport complex protein RnfE
MAVMAVLLMSNILISLLRNIIPDEIRIPVFIVIIATLVKCVEMLMHAFTPALFDSLGVFIPLIVVNCIILGRAESFASKNGVVDSIFDALGMGVGYLFAVLVMSGLRELIGTGGLSLLNPFDASQVIFDLDLFADFAISLFTQPAGAFITLGCILAFIQFLNIRKSKKEANK